MLNLQFDIKRINALKDILLRLRNDGPSLSTQADYDQHLQNLSVVDILLMQLELINGEYGISIEDIKRFSSFYPNLSGQLTSLDLNHPIQIFKEENTAFQMVMNQIDYLIESFKARENQIQKTDQVDELKHNIFQLGEFHKHYNRKEKLFFPILERYGYPAPTRTIWKVDTRIGSLYQALKKQFDQHPEINITRVRKRYEAFEIEFKEMIFQEETIILPILQSLFSEDDWVAIASESDAFGYAIIEPHEDKWVPKPGTLIKRADENSEMDKPITKTPIAQNIVLGGGGYLTTEEAKLVLDNLPLEITYVDKNDMFKYFNKITNASEMMLVRTPISIGRNVANCHPPKSLMKVMTLIRDLKTGKRTSETMWYKREDKYIHITYKSIYNEDGDFLGVLEYVQDIQPFFNLPSEVKTVLSKLEE